MVLWSQNSSRVQKTSYQRIQNSLYRQPTRMQYPSPLFFGTVVDTLPLPVSLSVEWNLYANKSVGKEKHACNDVYFRQQSLDYGCTCAQLVEQICTCWMRYEGNVQLCVPDWWDSGFKFESVSAKSCRNCGCNWLKDFVTVKARGTRLIASIWTIP